MIYTVTLNPSIDYIVHVDKLQIGDLNRMKSDIKLPGGKGINVSRILKRLGIENVALGFLGGFTGKFIHDWLKEEQIQDAFTEVAEDTRINIKLKSDLETEINGLGPVITDSERENLKNQVSKAKAGDIVILSGSASPSIPKDFYQELIQLIQENGADFVIDTTGQALLDALPNQPLLIKPNNHELEELFEVTFHSIEDILPFGKKLLELGAKHVLISMAGDGALLFTQDSTYQANVPKGKVKNSVGAGDSMIAGFTGTFSKTGDVMEAFRYGVASGSATAFSDDLATGEKIQALLEQVWVKKI